MKVLRSLRRRPLRTIQIEVTSRCTRRCAVCPRGVLAEQWRDGDLSDLAWKAIEPALSMTRHVHLQGWGEPLLHPRLPTMAAAAKAAGCTVGMTTNGDLLPDAIAWILELQVDVVTVSVGGTAHHGALRGGSAFGEKVAVAAELAGMVGRHGCPRVQLSYLLTRDNAHELEEAVRSAARHGIREVFAVHLDCTPVPELAGLAAFAGANLRDGVAQELAAAGRAAAELGITYRPAATASEDLLMCALDPTRLAFVSWDGRIGPCPYLLLPIEGMIPRAAVTEVRKVPPVSFGSVPMSDLAAILCGSARRRFTAPFIARLAAEDEFATAGLLAGFGAAALERLEEADRRRSAALAANPFPAACTDCHKRIGW